MKTPARAWSVARAAGVSGFDSVEDAFSHALEVAVGLLGPWARRA